jgi:hypothetical protein
MIQMKNTANGGFFRAVNDILLVVYLIHIVPDKTGMSKIFFSLGHQAWIWIRKKFINLSNMNMSRGFSSSVIHWVNYIKICIVKYI